MVNDENIDAPEKPDENTADITSEIAALRAEVARMNGHRFITLHDSLWRLGLFQLYRGLAFGLG